MCRFIEKMRETSACASYPLVPPGTTMVPPLRSAFKECGHVAWPTESITASTREGSRAPAGNVSAAPNERA